MMLKQWMPLVTLSINARFLSEAEFEGSLNAGRSVPDRLTRFVADSVLRFLKDAISNGPTIKMQSVTEIVDGEAFYKICADLPVGVEVEIDEQLRDELTSLPKRLATVSKRLITYLDQTDPIVIGVNIETSSVSLGVSSMLEQEFCERLRLFGFENDIYRDFKISVLDSEFAIIPLLPGPIESDFIADDVYQDATIIFPEKIKMRIGPDIVSVDIDGDDFVELVRQASESKDMQVKLSHVVRRGYGLTYERAVQLEEFTKLQESLDFELET